MSSLKLPKDNVMAVWETGYMKRYIPKVIYVFYYCRVKILKKHIWEKYDKVIYLNSLRS